jgi:membrane-associated phospholipid phosphatase
VEWAGVLATDVLVSGLKPATDRERPDGSDQSSMPSGHASATSAFASLAWRNVDQIEMPEGLRWSLRSGLLVLAGSSAWARVEAGKHFPTDVLVGAALGNFVTGFIHDAFLGPASPMRLNAYADPERGDRSVGVTWSW